MNTTTTTYAVAPEGLKIVRWNSRGHLRPHGSRVTLCGRTQPGGAYTSKVQVQFMCATCTKAVSA